MTVKVSSGTELVQTKASLEKKTRRQSNLTFRHAAQTEAVATKYAAAQFGKTVHPGEDI